MKQVLITATFYRGVTGESCGNAPRTLSSQTKVLPAQAGSDSPSLKNGPQRVQGAVRMLILPPCVGAKLPSQGLPTDLTTKSSTCASKMAGNIEEDESEKAPSARTRQNPSCGNPATPHQGASAFLRNTEGPLSPGGCPFHDLVHMERVWTSVWGVIFPPVGM